MALHRDAIKTLLRVIADFEQPSGSSMSKALIEVFGFKPS
jgi:hypothetical protein